MIILKTLIKMKKTKLFLTTIIILIFTNCGSVSNYTKNTLDKAFYKSKTIFFTLNQNSKTTMEIYGGMPILGGYKAPNVKEVFKKSIQELANETKLDLKFIESNEINSYKDHMLVDVEISEITWTFGISVATLKTDVNYNIINQNRNINTIGIRKSGGGSESNNLRKSLKNANYKFLQELQKSN
jgi:hypothetical protein